MRRINITVLVLFYISLIFIISCQSDKKRPAGEKSEVKPEQTAVTIHIERFEKDLFSTDPDSVEQAIPRLEAKYGEFFSITNYVLKLGAPKDPKYPEVLKKFFTDYFENLAYKKVLEVYPNLDELNQGLSKAFTRYKTYFPTKRIPRVYSWVSGWNQTVLTSDTILGIGLDLFLGRDCEYYANLQLSSYLRYTLDKKYIVPECMSEWGKTQFYFKDSAANLLSNMLYEGKIWYFTKQVLPETADSLIFGYTPNQMKWCGNNKKQMWSYLLEHKLLFSTDYMTIRKLVYPAPFTVYFTNESPGRAVVWLGYKIVESYMNNNSDITLPQLMAESDYQKILRKSNFKP